MLNKKGSERMSIHKLPIKREIKIPTNRLNWFKEIAKENGRRYLSSFAIGIIRVLVQDNNLTNFEKLEEINEVLSSLNIIFNDISLPWATEEYQNLCEGID